MPDRRDAASDEAPTSSSCAPTTPERGRAQLVVAHRARSASPSAFGLDPRDDVQVLTPMHRGPAGTDGAQPGAAGRAQPRRASPRRAAARTLPRRRQGDAAAQRLRQRRLQRRPRRHRAGRAPRRRASCSTSTSTGARCATTPTRSTMLDLAYARQRPQEPGVGVSGRRRPAPHGALRHAVSATCSTRRSRAARSWWCWSAPSKAIRRAVSDADAGQRWTGLAGRLSE